MKLLFPVIFSWCYSGAGPLPACYSEQVDGPVKFCFGIFAFKSTFAFKYLLSNRPSPDMFTLQSCLSGALGRLGEVRNRRDKKVIYFYEDDGD